ncbi:MAG: hypothetical protein LBV18_07690 [Alistipes sp.]|jgi:hypothetical protein|nr:hypothetical protein [Alistipes sp.]
MESVTGLSPRLLQAVIEKSNLSQRIYDNTFAVMTKLKEILHELASELDEELEERLDERVRIEYRDRGKYEAHFFFGENLLIFSMHTDIFRFAPGDAIWNNAYVADAPDNAACGIINVWNFLKDSFEHKRPLDEGYLVARIFVNREMQFMVEGKGQGAFLRPEFGRHQVTKDALGDVVEAAIDYSLSFDLLVPPYQSGKVATAEQFNTRLENSKMQTGKRLGYEFETEDIK